MNLFQPESQEIVLRPYQSAAIDALRDKIREGKRRVILCGATAFGKTVCASKLLKEADNKGSYSAFIVDRITLVNQTSDVFDRYGIGHGIVQGINDRWSPFENIQVCSAQTLARRMLPRPPKLIVVDEAHAQHKSTLKFMEENPDAVCVGLTATPFSAGMADHWDGIVDTVTARQLINEGYLIEPKVFVAKSPEDSEYGRNSFGEFSDESAASAGIRIVGDVVKEWISKTHEFFGGPAKTIVFSPTVEHGRELCAAFAAAGYNFQQISYMDRSDDERAAKIGEFRRPDSIIHGLVSCGVLTKGFDVADCRIGISCKPYRKSLSSHMQEVGRLMRTHPDKDLALWICHSGNFERFALDLYDVWENGVGELSKAEKHDKKPRERSEQTREKVVCPECSGALRGLVCTCCGWEKPARSGIHAVDGELYEFNAQALAMEARPGLRAACLKDPKAVYNAALCYAIEHCRDGDCEKSRKQAYAIWKGIFPTEKPPFGWFDMKATLPDAGAYSLAEREVKRFRKNSRRAA
ncbi:DEAD/DEAH box helicase [Martelella limonii]|uniref:DEAD/DEAH box helicase n=1 Tax=Martelella limonii TaxID=1647649 RepID=UPI00157FFDA8|nr:DEAD/DEAH box helicase family protein [Martelella limonii]